MELTDLGKIINIHWMSPYLDRVEIVFDDGRLYVGKYVNNKLNGQGIVYYDNGDVFEGIFCNNIPRGPGKYVTTTYDTGITVTYDGIFDNTYFEGTITYEDGMVYFGEAEVIDGAYEGIGQWIRK